MLPKFDDSDIAAFLGRFEAGTLPKAEWTHSAHLLGGAWYVYSLGPEQALDHMRTCVRRYNEAVGGQNTATSGYHETVTVFWIKLLAATLKQERLSARANCTPAPSRAGFCRMIVERYATDRAILTRFYDFDVIASPKARCIWIAPTKALLDESA